MLRLKSAPTANDNFVVYQSKKSLTKLDAITKKANDIHTKVTTSSISKKPSHSKNNATFFISNKSFGEAKTAKKGTTAPKLITSIIEDIRAKKNNSKNCFLRYCDM